MGRGPSYPFVDLEQAIGATRKIYEYAKRSAAPSNSVVETALGYSLKSSGGIKTIAALKSYGLIEEIDGNNGKALKITDRAYRILIDDADSPERLQAIKDAALSPKWYEYCWQKWGAEMPLSMRSNLLMDHGFVPTTVDAFLRDYKRTIEFARICDNCEDPEPQDVQNKDSLTPKSYLFKAGDYVQWDSQGVLRFPVARRLIRYEGDYAFVEGYLSGIPADQLIAGDPPDEIVQVALKPPAIQTPIVVGGVKMQTDTLTLSDGITVQFQWPNSISKEAYEDFLYQLEGFKRRIGRAVQKEPIPEGPSNGTQE
jgi:hypothetical protein